MKVRSLVTDLPGGGRTHRPIEVVRRLGWGVADQAVSSLSNFAFGILVARSLGSAGFGAFSLAYVTYAFVLSATRGLATDPLLVRFSSATPRAWRRAVSASSATAATAGVIAGVLCVLAGFVMPHDMGGAFIALGVGLPGLLLQDSWRFAFFAQGRPGKALVNDLVWGLLLVAALISLIATGRENMTTVVLAFGATASLAAGFGFLQTRVPLRVSRVRAWVVDNKSLGSRYLVENVSIGGARQIRFFVLEAVAGLAAVGNVRAAEILMGPFLVILMGASQVAVPEAVQVLERAPRRLGHFCLGLGGVLSTAAASWGVLILLLLPTGLGDLLLGPTWVPASHLLPPVIIGMVLGGFEIAAAAGVRGLGAVRRSLKAQLINGGLYVVGGGTGAILYGALGSCWGVAVAGVFGTVVWLEQLRRGNREHVTALEAGGAVLPGQAKGIAT